jgi:hypothetical protein
VPRCAEGQHAPGHAAPRRETRTDSLGPPRARGPGSAGRTAPSSTR